MHQGTSPLEPCEELQGQLVDLGRAPFRSQARPTAASSDHLIVPPSDRCGHLHRTKAMPVGMIGATPVK